MTLQLSSGPLSASVLLGVGGFDKGKFLPVLLKVVHQENGVVEKLLLVRVRLYSIKLILLSGQKAWLGEKIALSIEFGVHGLYDEARRSTVEVILAADKPGAHLNTPV